MTYTTIVIDNHGKVYDLGAGMRVPTAKDTWGRNAFTCPVDVAAKIPNKAKPKTCPCCGKAGFNCQCMKDCF